MYTILDIKCYIVNTGLCIMCYNIDTILVIMCYNVNIVLNIMFYNVTENATTYVYLCFMIGQPLPHI